MSMFEFDERQIISLIHNLDKYNVKLSKFQSGQYKTIF